MTNRTLSLLDCTLRDGGYATNHCFADGDAASLVAELHRGGVKFIEIGYFRRDSNGIPPRHGAFSCDAGYVARCKAAAGQALLTVMVRMNDVAASALSALPAMGVSMVRIPVTPMTINGALPYVEAARSAGLLVAINLIRASEIDLNDLCRLAARASALMPDIVYVADSNGSMRPAQVHASVLALKKALNGSATVGFHPHDSLSLGLANSLEAIAAGASMIDGSLGGIGKGGNLATELLLVALPPEHRAPLRVTPLVRAVRRCIVPHLGSHTITRIEHALGAALDANQDMLEGLRRQAIGQGRLLTDVLAEEFDCGTTRALPPKAPLRTRLSYPITNLITPMQEEVLHA